MLLFERRTEALSSCASILEEKGAFERSYCLYFRGEGSLQTELLPLFWRRREPSNRATASILEETGVSNRATASILKLNGVSRAGIGFAASILEDFSFWLPKWRFFGCRLSAFGCRLRLVLVADSALFLGADS